jgi:hypothetical protein
MRFPIGLVDMSTPWKYQDVSLSAFFAVDAKGGMFLLSNEDSIYFNSNAKKFIHQSRYGEKNEDIVAIGFHEPM